MGGRVKRMRALAAIAMRDAAAGDAPPGCALCARPLGRRVEWHHPVPKSRGGTQTVPVHPICHRVIHATLTNQALATTHADPQTLRQHEEIARFLRWVADKPPDFHAPTRRLRDR